MGNGPDERDLPMATQHWLGWPHLKSGLLKSSSEISTPWQSCFKSLPHSLILPTWADLWNSSSSACSETWTTFFLMDSRVKFASLNWAFTIWPCLCLHPLTSLFSSEQDFPSWQGATQVGGRQWREASKWESPGLCGEDREWGLVTDSCVPSTSTLTTFNPTLLLRRHCYFYF